MAATIPLLSLPVNPWQRIHILASGHEHKTNFEIDTTKNNEKKEIPSSRTLPNPKMRGKRGTLNMQGTRKCGVTNGMRTYYHHNYYYYYYSYYYYYYYYYYCPPPTPPPPPPPPPSPPSRRRRRRRRRLLRTTTPPTPTSYYYDFDGDDMGDMK